MIKINYFFCLFIGTFFFTTLMHGMEQPNEKRKLISLLEAFMRGSFTHLSHEKVDFSDYEKPETLYSASFQETYSNLVRLTENYGRPIITRYKVISQKDGIMTFEPLPPLPPQLIEMRRLKKEKEKRSYPFSSESLTEEQKLDIQLNRYHMFVGNKDLKQSKRDQRKQKLLNRSLEYFRHSSYSRRL